MKVYNVLVLGLFGFIAGSAQSVHAQFQFPQSPAPALRDVKWQEVRDGQDMGHGTLVSIRLNNGNDVKGHIVRYDGAEKKLYVRVKPGQAPEAFAENQIQRMEKAVRSNAQGRLTTVIEPEIVTQTIWNGSQRMVTSHSDVLTTQERSLLADLRRTENNVAQLNYQREQRERALALESSFQDERLRTQVLVNEAMRNENINNYPYPPSAVEVSGIYRKRVKGLVEFLPQAIPPGISVADRLPPVDPQILAKANEELARMQTQAVYEDGRLVAVVVK